LRLDLVAEFGEQAVHHAQQVNTVIYTTVLGRPTA